MRLKKVMSLVLAGAMALSLVTVASAADTKVYLNEDFDSYTSYQQFANGYFTTGDNIISGQTPGEAFKTAAVEANANAAGTVYARSWHNGAVTSGTDIVDGKYYPMHTPSAGWTNKLAMIPKEQWNFNTADGETYIVSYDFAGEPYETTGAPASHLEYVNGTTTLWVNDAKSSMDYVPGATFSFSNSTAKYYLQVVTSGMTMVPGVQKQVNSNTPYRIALAYKKSGDSLNRIWALDGAAWHNVTETRGNKNIFGITLAGSTTLQSYYDNVRAYTIKNNDFRVYAETATGVSTSQKTIRFRFSNPVARATYSNAVVVKKGNEVMDGGYTVLGLNDYVGAVGKEIYSYVDIRFDELEQGAEYTVEFPKTITNEIATQLGSNNVATFATKMPDIKANPLTVVNASNLVANGSLQAVKSVLTNTTNANKNVAAIYAVYTSLGQLADVVYVNDEVAGLGTTEIEVGVELGTNLARGTLKAFYWDGMTTLKPYTGSQTIDIAE